MIEIENKRRKGIEESKIFRREENIDINDISKIELGDF